MKKKIKFHREKIIHRNTQERERYITFFNQKCDYYFNFEFYIPIGYCNLGEYLFLKKAVRELSPLVRPEKLAEYLKAENMQNEINNYLVKASKPKDDFEKMLVDKMVKELGVVTTVGELSKFLKMNKTCLYKAMDNGEILSFKRGRRRYVITEGVLPFLRD